MGEHNFQWALTMLNMGKRLTREGWNRKGMWVEKQSPDPGSKMSRPYLFINPGKDWLVPWIPGNWDLFAIDWELVGE